MYLIRHGQSQFNAVFSTTRVDPGIEDPVLTEIGVQQAHETARRLVAMRDSGAHEISRLIVSPYTRTLQTAAIFAEALGVDVTVEPLVRERAAFACDVGTRRDTLQQRFPGYRLGHLDEMWWHDHVARGAAEAEDVLAERGAAFLAAMEREQDWRHVVVVTHYGFIRSLTGYVAKNGEIVRLKQLADCAGNFETL